MRYYIIISLYCILSFFLPSVLNASDNKFEISQLRDRIAVLNVTIEELREEVKKLSGIISETEYRLNSKIENSKSGSDSKNENFQDIKNAIRNSQKRITAIENFFGIINNSGDENRNNENETNNISNEAKSAEKPTKSNRQQEKELYNTAKNLYDTQDYEKALANFNAILKTYPNSIYTDNCYFWVGEIFYKKKMYKQAILKYQKVIEDFPNGNKTPSAYLKQAISFYKLGEKEHAFIILKEIISKYPNSNEARNAEKKLEAYK
ncbi:MAG: tol-pal system protein YbgF [Deltaproteobacteria bacterium]|nr:tol-pal system protein YbgF [Deltaproteobacteria bacterium]